MQNPGTGSIQGHPDRVYALCDRLACSMQHAACMQLHGAAVCIDRRAGSCGPGRHMMAMDMMCLGRGAACAPHDGYVRAAAAGGSGDAEERLRARVARRAALVPV